MRLGDIFIRGIELPLTVKGVTVLDCDGNFNVYINILLSYETQRNATKHEIKHIKNRFNDIIIVFLHHRGCHLTDLLKTSRPASYHKTITARVCLGLFLLIWLFTEQMWAYAFPESCNIHRTVGLCFCIFSA